MTEGGSADAAERAKQDLLDTVNKTGYPLQLAVSDALKRSSARLQVVAEEHRWVTPDEGAEGFADIILRTDLDHFPAALVLVLECKRRAPQKGALQFLVASDEGSDDLATVAFAEQGQDWGFWQETSIGPVCPRALFSLGRDENPSGRREVEVAGKELTPAAYAIACETARDFTGRYGVIVVPVLVTTAELQVCRFRPQDLHLRDGLLTDAAYEPVPIVKVHRSFGGPGHYRTGGRPFVIRSTQARRTLFVVNAAAVVDFVEGFGVTASALSGVGWSWKRD